MKNDELFHKWVNKQLSEEELAEFKSRPDFESLSRIYKATDQFAAPTFDEEGMLKEILASKKESQKPQPTGRRRFLNTWIKYGVAASVLIFAGWYLSQWSGSTVVYQLAKGEKTEGILPDGSTFILNAESSLSYNKNNWSKNRTIKLKGEAFFEVKRGHTFKVETPTGAVQVLGTKFNVRSRAETMEVRCHSGKVAVFSEDKKSEEILLVNEAVRFDLEGKSERWTFNAEGKASWISGISKFKKSTLEQILKELERQYNIQIDSESINTTEIISCNFPHNNLELALKAVLSPMEIKFELKENKKIRLFR